MGRQSGDIFKEGTVDGLIYYKTEHGYLVRSKGNLNKARVTEDPAFEGSRKASAEFGRAAAASKVIRQALREHCPYALNSRTHYRLNALFGSIIKKDDTNEAGNRKVLPTHIQPLKEFLWHEGQPLNRTFWGQMSGSTGDDGTLTITMPGFLPKRDLSWPHNATHAEITVLTIAADFDAGAGTSSAAKSGPLPKTAIASDIVLHCSGVAKEHEIMVAGIGVEFFQEEGGNMVSLKEGCAFGIVA